MNHWKQRKIEPMKLDGVSVSSIILEEREESDRRLLAAHQQPDRNAAAEQAGLRIVQV